MHSFIWLKPSKVIAYNAIPYPWPASIGTRVKDPTYPDFNQKDYIPHSILSGAKTVQLVYTNASIVYISKLPYHW